MLSVAFDVECRLVFDALNIDVECRLAFDAATKRAFLHTNHVRVMQQLHAPFCTPIMRPLFLLWPTYWFFKHNAHAMQMRPSGAPRLQSWATAVNQALPARLRSITSSLACRD